MTTPATPEDHFAHCVQILGGTTAASRRLGIDERAIRRFITAERPSRPASWPTPPRPCAS